MFYICYQTFLLTTKTLLDSLKLFLLSRNFPIPFFVLYRNTMNATKIFFFDGMVSFDSPESNSKIHQTMLKIPIVNREKNPIQPNWVSVPRRWESGRVLDTRKENDYNSEFGQVMYLLKRATAILILNQSHVEQPHVSKISFHNIKKKKKFLRIFVSMKRKILISSNKT